MGQHKPGWEKPVSQALKKAFESESYPKVKRMGKFGDLFQVVPIDYNSVFERYREKWQDGPKEILDFISAGDSFKKTIGTSSAKRKATVKNIESTIAKVRTEGDFFWQYLLDVVLYRFHLIVRSEVNVLVARQILDGLDAADGVNTDWSVISHSLGTAVIHNVLHALYENEGHVPAEIYDPGVGEDDDGKTWPVTKLRVGTTRPKVLAMVANVSRLLQLPYDPMRVYNTKVRPGTEAEGAICHHYLNINHKYDPFPRFRPYTPDELSGKLSAFGAARLRHASPEVIRDANVHALEHYAADPEFHAALFRALYREAIVTDTQLTEALVKHKKGSLKDTLDETRDALELLIPAPREGIEKFLESFRAFAKLV
jgi:hypothetical protein